MKGHDSSHSPSAPRSRFAFLAFLALLARGASGRFAFGPLACPAAVTVVVAAAVLAVPATGCVDPFRGSNIQVTFESGVPTPAPEGTTPPVGVPPADTLFSFYAVDFVFERDDDGGIVVDGTGDPVVVDAFAFHVEDFEIRPLIDLDSPCFIEGDSARFPGLHVTRLGEQLRRETGIDDPLNPPPCADSPRTCDNRVIDILTADRRMGNLQALQDTVKVLTSVSHARYPTPGTMCVADGGSPAELPPIACTDEPSNQARLALCQAFWADHPDHYEGNDKVFTIPLNGEFRGVVDGLNPINNGGLGGAGFFVDEVLTGLDSLIINWQFKDYDGVDGPDYPDDFPVEERSEIGFLFMQGLAVEKTRGVINVPLRHPTASTIAGEAVVFPDLGEDQVNF